MSAWNASAIRSNISLKYSVISFGVPTGASGILNSRVVRLLSHLHAALDLANGIEIVADDAAVLHAEAGLQALRLRLHAIEDTAGFREDLGAFLIGVALSEELLEDRARVAFLRQRLGGRAPGDAGAALSGGEFERRQTRVLSDVADGDLVGAHAGVRTGLAEVPGLHGRSTSLARCRRGVRAFPRACCAGRRRWSDACGTARGACRIGDMVKSVPVSFGDQRSMIAP